MLEEIFQSLDIIVIIAIIFWVLGYRPLWWDGKRGCEKSIRDIPGPFPLPLLGSRWTFSKIGGYSFNNIHEYYQDMHVKYGPIFREEALWNIPIVSIFERSDIEKVLKSAGRYPVRPPTEAIAHYRKSRPDRYTSTGLVNEQGPMWQNLRSALTNELTSPRTISNFLPEVQEIAEDFCHLIKHLRTEGNRILELEKLTERLGLEASCALVLGRRMGFLLPGGGSSTALRLAEAVHEHFIACRDTYYGLPFWKFFPTSSYKRLVASEENIYNLALELTASADESTRESAVFQSVLDAPLDNREKTAAIVDFIAAGIHTLRNSLIFLLYVVSDDPEVQECVFREILSSGVGSGAYLKACMQECFRLLPTANCLARVSEQKLELAGYRVPAGSVVLCHTGIACKNESNFLQAGKFRPERWIGPEKADTVAAATYLVTPFGYGRRACPGRRFVEQVLAVVLEAVVQHFTMRTCHSLELQFEFLLAPKAPVSLIFQDRS